MSRVVDFGPSFQVGAHGSCGEYENRGRSETKGQVDIYGSKLSLFYRKFDRKLVP